MAKLGSNPVPQADTTPPTCAISSPASGVTASGTITVSVSASDNVGVASVQLIVDDAVWSTDSASPYSFAWDTTTVGNGNHSLTAKAVDAAGNPGTSTSITINVQNPVSDITRPVCAITSPTSSATVSGTITPTATASDNVGVSMVEFYVDGVLRVTDTASPYSFSWDTTTVSNGSHTLVAKAYDGANNTATSASVSVTVQNSGSDSLPPTAVITSPAMGSNVAGNVKVSVSATDNTRVARVDLYVDGSPYASSTSATVVFTWSAGKAGKGRHTLAARAVDTTGNVGAWSSVTVYK